MKNVMTYGTFDLFHYGHLRLLERAKALGDHLTVAVSTDDFNAVKGKKCTYPFEHRARIVAAIRYVDRVIPERNWEQKVDDIKKFNIDVFVIGDDWQGKFDHLREYCEVVYLPRTSNISTTEIKQNVHKEVKRRS
ncbi:glycerol-3-phosphate cytidylyltransferase [bacterium]|nr:glycerol-3-phosphate cytidylyltransferase [bacterium]